MSTQYQCEAGGRRQLLLEQPPGPGRINAIDFVVVHDGPDVPEGLRQRVVAIKFLFDDNVATITAAQVAVTGGVVVVDPGVRWVTPAPAINAPGGVGVDATFDPALTAAERAWFAGLPATLSEPDRWLVVLLDAYGDFSAYTLALRTVPGGDQPPPGFDGRLSHVALHFKVECPSPFDCREESPCPPQIETAPALDYLARDYASFRRLMLERLALTQPDVPVGSPAQTQTAVVEALAYVADHASYYLDAVNTEAYLGTARRRTSVRRHARLRDYEMHEGCNARVFVHLAVADGVSIVRTLVEPAVVEAGAAFATRVEGHGAVVREAGQVDVLSQAPVVFEAMHPLRALVDAHGEIPIHTWGETNCCLPIGATTATVRDVGDRLALQPGDYLLLEEIRDPQTLQAADADPTHRHVVRLVEVSPSYEDPIVLTNGLPTPVRDLRWDVEDALPFALALTQDDQVLAVARANLVLCDHGATHQTPVDRPLALQSFGRHEQLRTGLAEPNLTWREPYDAAAPARQVMQQRPAAARPQIVLQGEGERWLPFRDLINSAASSRDFVVEMENDRRAWLRFGDDKKGRRPLPSTTFAATFRVGNGPEGNVGAGALAHALVDPATFDAGAVASLRVVSNPLPAGGGTKPETLQETRLYAPHAFRRQERAVTAEDWAEVAMRHPQIQNAVATLQWTGSWHTVYVSVDRREGLPVDEVFTAQMLAHLERYRLAGYDLNVSAPHWVPLDIGLTVCVEPGFFPEQVQRQLTREFSTAPIDDGRLGFFHPDEFSFAQDVFLSPIIARASAVPGVRWVNATPSQPTHESFNRFKRYRKAQGTEVADGRLPIGRLEIARCDNDRNAPDNGRIRFRMLGGT